MSRSARVKIVRDWKTPRGYFPVGVLVFGSDKQATVISVDQIDDFICRLREAQESLAHAND